MVDRISHCLAGDDWIMYQCSSATGEEKQLWRILLCLLQVTANHMVGCLLPGWQSSYKRTRVRQYFTVHGSGVPCGDWDGVSTFNDPTSNNGWMLWPTWSSWFVNKIGLMFCRWLELLELGQLWPNRQLSRVAPPWKPAAHVYVFYIICLWFYASYLLDYDLFQRKIQSLSFDYYGDEYLQPIQAWPRAQTSNHSACSFHASWGLLLCRVWPMGRAAIEFFTSIYSNWGLILVDLKAT